MQPLHILILAINIVAIAAFIKLRKLDPVYAWLIVIVSVEVSVALIRRM